MLNFKFIKSQFKTVWVLIVSFSFIFTVLVAFGTIFPSFAENAEIINHEGGGSFSSGSMGAAPMILNNMIFGISSLLIFLGFGMAMSITLINKDINKGYIVSWMTTGMSRNNIFISKMLVIISSTFFVNLWLVFIEMICFGLRMGDFQSNVGYLLFANFELLCFSLLVVSFTWLIFSLIRKNGIAILIVSGVGAWFFLCFLMIFISKVDPSLTNLKYFKYFTIQSLFNSPLKYGDLQIPTEVIDDEGKTREITGVYYAPLLPLKASDYAWQIPLMIFGSVSLFTGGHLFIKKQDFAF